MHFARTSLGRICGAAGNFHSQRKRELGFSLVEALVVLTILAIVAATAIPGLSHFVRQQRVETSAMRLLSHLQLARQTAIARGQRVTMLANANEAWDQGWYVFIDRDADAERDDDESTIAEAEALPDGVTLRGNASVKQWISFSADGSPTLLNGGFQAGTLRLCGDGGTGVAIIMSRSGRVRLDRSAQTTRCA